MVDRKGCPMRTDLGNCTPVGGFCFNAVSDEICEALHSAYNKGFNEGAEKMKEYLVGRMVFEDTEGAHCETNV